MYFKKNFIVNKENKKEKKIETKFKIEKFISSLRIIFLNP